MDRDQLIEEIKKQILEEIKGAASPLTDKISDEQKAEMMEMKNTLETSVKENPWMAVGIAALCGFMIGRLIYRRND
ncbi:glycine zipper domain-containing protein [Bdellovibrio sp. HCB209]|uniref:glycine zipper domain-containing protein n=1 Tax=Bdellovibrio sp. HCB209 TaxID=3394354 RepID=UPI0039B4556B